MIHTPPSLYRVVARQIRGFLLPQKNRVQPANSLQCKCFVSRAMTRSELVAVHIFRACWSAYTNQGERPLVGGAGLTIVFCGIVARATRGPWKGTRSALRTSLVQPSSGRRGRFLPHHLGHVGAAYQGSAIDRPKSDRLAKLAVTVESGGRNILGDRESVSPRLKVLTEVRVGRACPYSWRTALARTPPGTARWNMRSRRDF